MVEYNKCEIIRYSTEKKLKNAAKNKTGTTLRINLRIFNGNS